MNRSLAKLKEKARIHEQKEEWSEAIQAYQQAITISEEGEGEAELSLFNRIGDLYLRVGKQDDAVRYYELAADHYEAAGLYNSAIALCNKVLRHDRNRAEPYYKLGRLSLAQGFSSEARRWSVEYAERMLRAGRRKEAFAALSEFADLASDPEMRELLAQYLQAHGETAEALSQLHKAYQEALQGGQADQARALREKVLALDPRADLAALETERSPGARPVAGGTAGSGDLDDWADTAELYSGGGDGLTGDADAELPGLMLETAADSAGIESLMPEIVQSELVEIDLPPILDPADAEIELDQVPATDKLATSPSEQDLALPGQDDLPGYGELLDLDLTTMSFGLDTGGQPDAGLEDDDELPPLPALDDLDLTVGSAPAIGEHPAPPVAESRMATPAEPRVEVPVKPAAEPPLELAAAPAVTTAAEPVAKPVARPVPNFLQEPERSRGGGTAEAAAEYVDLASLLQDDPAETGLTRYIVEAPSPSGDEDRDFLDMLSQFKAKVSEHLGDEDAESRYDLGLAFKEMGLIDEAISQFQIALRGLDNHLKIYEELGDCFILKGDFTVALKILLGALRLSDDGSAELIGVHYQLGRSYEELGRNAEARDAYERVIALDLEFRDASLRLSRL